MVNESTGIFAQIEANSIKLLIVFFRLTQEVSLRITLREAVAMSEWCSSEQKTHHQPASSDSVSSDPRSSGSQGSSGGHGSQVECGFVQGAQEVKAD